MVDANEDDKQEDHISWFKSKPSIYLILALASAFVTIYVGFKYDKYKKLNAESVTLEDKLGNLFDMRTTQATQVLSAWKVNLSAKKRYKRDAANLYGNYNKSITILDSQTSGLRSRLNVVFGADTMTGFDKIKNDMRTLHQQIAYFNTHQNEITIYKLNDLFTINDNIIANTRRLIEAMPTFFDLKHPEPFTNL